MKNYLSGVRLPVERMRDSPFPDGFASLVPEPIRNKVRVCDRALGISYEDGGRRRSCKLEGWCPACTDVAQAEREGTLQDLLKPAFETYKGFFRISFPLPAAREQDLREACNHGLGAAQRAVADAFELRGKAGKTIRENAWSQIGAIVRYHPFGGPRRSWPQWAPSIEMLLPLVKVTDSGSVKLKPKSSTYSDIQEADTLTQSFYARYKDSIKGGPRGLTGDLPDWSTYTDDPEPSPIVRIPPPGRGQRNWRKGQFEAFTQPFFDLRRFELVEDNLVSYDPYEYAWGETPNQEPRDAEDAFSKLHDLQARCRGDTRRYKTTEYLGVASQNSSRSW